MRLLKISIVVIIIIGIIYWFGPHPSEPVYSSALLKVPANATALQQYVSQQEMKHIIKKDNEAEIVWADSNKKQKTPYAIVYLHGFSASKQEGYPVHENI